MAAAFIRYTCSIHAPEFMYPRYIYIIVPPSFTVHYLYIVCHLPLLLVPPRGRIMAETGTCITTGPRLWTTSDNSDGSFSLKVIAGGPDLASVSDLIPSFI